MIENVNQNSCATADQLSRFVLIQGKLLNQYLKVRSIGEGPYSKIKLMRNTQDGELYAMKKYNLFVLKKKNKLMKKEKGQGIHMIIQYSTPVLPIRCKMKSKY